MDQKHLGRLNQLFEKMVSNAVSTSEKNELAVLYNHFIDEGRSGGKVSNFSRQNKTSRSSY